MEEAEIDFKPLSIFVRVVVDRISQVLSKTLRMGAAIELLDIHNVDISLITEQLVRHNTDVSAAITSLYGDFISKFMLLINLKDTLLLTDLFLKKPVGTTKTLDAFSESAVGETCNILASCLCNILRSHFAIKVRPTPPITVTDYIGTVFSTFILDNAVLKDQLLIIETRFHVLRCNIKCNIFLLPAHGAVETLISKMQK